ncbi:MAG: thiamine pyrophosphate-dependent enzyme [Candidatus Fermentibacteraceae bacterium]
MSYIHEIEGLDIAWCPGCGNFAIRKALMAALEDLEVPPQKLVIASGIGQAPKMPHYLRCNCFNGLHGRTLPVATAIKACNRGLTVIAEGGDGDMYGEGGNHFIHCLRRNPDIVHLVHNNMVYGLTKGQASPTSMRGFQTPVQTEGVILEPFNPIAVAVALDASFVARSFAGHGEHLKTMIMEAARHRGYALVDIFQPCVSFNRVNDYKWFEEHTYQLEEGYDPTDRQAAFGKAMETEKMPLGAIYRNPDRKTFEQQQPAWEDDSRPLHERETDMDELRELVESFRG